ncbi:hypothetical protein [Undibacterium oligocarboniphilum]|uniref:Uncharacterized protein n=1 Tax=Undibacterium oligocarboniphilum TaxID=666702 RepID=A0A850QQ83_9BURK|nr:hypothetical protein [Undibacterium oligocarboniphilum]MBC3871494.1 hypothetical protein [Undibacterium oligocarboniphilum]NVO78930.1 hypothetical protein [Undibacterium oligocarboniphilum]
MKIKILFSYVEYIVPPRCRNPRPVRFHDGEIELEVPEIQSDAAPVAIRATYKRDSINPYQMEYRWYHNRLWTAVQCYRGEPQFDKETKDASKYAMYSDTIDLRSKYRLENRDFGMYLSIVTNSKVQAIEYLREWAKHQLIIDNIRYQPCGEPHYVVMTFGMGSNHGGTACMIDGYYDQNDCNSSVFSLLERESAITKATEVATQRGDTKSLPIIPHGPEWEILIAEAIQIKPLEQRVRKFVGHIKTDIEGSTCEFEFEVSATASEEEIDKEAREAAFNHVEWSYRQV